jgi:hypothetical protein
MRFLLNSSEKQIFRAVTIFGFAVALIVQGVRGFQYVILQHDGRNDYVTQAKEMVLGWSYMLENPNLLGHGMGFSLLIAIIFKVTNSESFLLLKLLFAILHGLSALLIAKLGFTLGMKRKYWILAALLFSMDPFVLFAVSDVTTEPLVTFFVLYWAYLYVCVDSHKNMNNVHLPLLTLTCFYSVIARPNSLLPVLAISLLIFLKWKNMNFPPQKMVLAGSFFLFLMTAYHVILFNLYRGFVFLTPVGGYNAEVMCSKEFVPQYIGLISKSENSRINDWVYGITKGPEILANQTTLDVSQLNSELWRIGIAKCLENPIESFFVLALKPLALWRPYVVFGAYSPWVFLASLLLWIPLLTATVYFITRRDLGVVSKQLRIYFLLMAAAFTVSLELTPTQIRHRVAFAEPFLWIFFFWVIGKFDSRRIKTKQSVSGSKL